MSKVKVTEYRGAIEVGEDYVMLGKMRIMKPGLRRAEDVEKPEAKQAAESTDVSAYDPKYARRVAPAVARSFSRGGYLPPVGREIVVAVGPEPSQWSESPRARLVLANVSGEFYLRSRNTDCMNWPKQFGVFFDASGEVLMRSETQESTTLTEPQLSP